MAPSVKNPYVGPRSFEEEDKAYFFGRDVEASNLRSLVVSQRLVLFYAQSGAGKSSLINTRLIPELRQEAFHVLPTARVSGQLPAGIGQVDNIFIFNMLLNLEGGHPQPESLNALSQKTLSEYLQTHHATPQNMVTIPGVEASRVLIIDQFEEIVTTHLDHWHKREAFFLQLREAMQADHLLWVLLAMREDHIAALEPYAHLLPGNLRSRYYMQRMRAPAAIIAVSEPARLAGRPFEEGVARQLIDNLRQVHAEEETAVSLGEFVEPVQLQVVCRTLWQNLQQKPADVISAANLEELGNVDQTLADFYDSAVFRAAQETGESEFSIRNWFERKLITEAGTRGTVYQGSEQTAGLDNDAVRVLANQYLLRAENRAGGAWYELVHDRFVFPILQSNTSWRERQNPLLQAVEKWDRSGREKALLYAGAQLEQTLATVNRRDLEPLVQEFLEASEEAQSQYALAAAQAQAETERLRADTERMRAEQERREANRLRFITVALIIMVLLAAIATVGAFIERSNANANATLAIQNEATAIANATIAWNNAVVAGQNAEAALSSAAAAIRLATAVALSQAEADQNERIAVENAAMADANATNVWNNAMVAAESIAVQEALIATQEYVLTAVPIVTTPSTILITPQPSATPLPTLSSAQTASIETFRIGQTVQGKPLEVVRFGNGAKAVVLVGGMQAGFSPGTVALAEQAVAYYEANPQAIPDDVSLYILPSLNRDSPIAAGRLEGRLNANGVDLNRNWDCNWNEDASWSGIVVPGSGGSKPFSEPETRSLRNFLQRVRPEAVVLWYARASGGLASAGGCGSQSQVSGPLSEIYGKAAGYNVTDYANFVGAVEGDASNWLDERGVAAVSIVLPTYEQPDWENNLAGIQAVINAVGG